MRPGAVEPARDDAVGLVGIGLRQVGAAMDPARLAALETAWRGALNLQHRIEPIKAREVLAMAATARWIIASARERKETRGIQRRVDIPGTDPAQSGNVRSGGLGSVWAGPVEQRLQENRT